MNKGILQQLESGKPKERTCILIRHGETKMNDKDIVRGWTETPLDDEGIHHATSLGKKLKGSKIDCLIASDLLRTLQTALVISEYSDIPIIATNSCLHTWNVGEFTGKPAAKADPILERMAIEEPDKVIKDGESFDNFKHRYLIGLIALMNEYSDKTVAFVTHGRNLAVMNAWKEAGYPPDFELDNDCLGYDEFDPGTAHLFDIRSNYLI